MVEPADHATPETLFERRWALTVIDACSPTFAAQWTDGGTRLRVRRAQSVPAGTAPAGRLRRRGGPPRVRRKARSKTAVHRLRRRFQSLLRERVAETVADGRDVDDEIRHLIQALSA